MSGLFVDSKCGILSHFIKNKTDIDEDIFMTAFATSITAGNY